MGDGRTAWVKEGKRPGGTPPPPTGGDGRVDGRRKGGCWGGGRGGPPESPETTQEDDGKNFRETKTNSHFTWFYLYHSFLLFRQISVTFLWTIGSSSNGWDIVFHL
jgi:hypothetical protein